MDAPQTTAQGSLVADGATKRLIVKFNIPEAILPVPCTQEAMAWVRASCRSAAPAGAGSA